MKNTRPMTWGKRLGVAVATAVCAGTMLFGAGVALAGDRTSALTILAGLAESEAAQEESQQVDALSIALGLLKDDDAQTTEQPQEEASSQSLMALVLGTITDETEPAGDPSTPAVPSAQAAPAQNGLEPNAAGEVVVFDNEFASMTLSNFVVHDPKDYYDYSMDVTYVNKTADTKLMFAFDNPALNGWMMSAYATVSVEAGETSTTTANWVISNWDALGFEDICEISFGMRVYDSDNWQAEKIVDEAFTVYPLGAAALKDYSYTLSSSDIVAVDNENITIAVLGYIGNNESYTNAFALDVFLENKTDQTLTFAVDNAVVNGYMFDPYYAVTLTPHKQVRATVGWSANGLAQRGIDEVTSITIGVRVYDANDYSVPKLLDDMFTLYPKGYSAVQDNPREAQPTDVVLYDGENATVIMTSYGEGSWGGFEIGLYVENKTDQTVRFNIDSAALNGTDSNPYWGIVLYPNAKAYSSVTWSTNTLEKIGLTKEDISEVTWNIYARDNSSYSAPKLFEEKQTISIEW
ncbi:MAG: hypothetical protein IKE43_12480 [Coriobacteriales bacterium]|nr:hypothetical protein [Coriobacteriales bacterium]